MMTMSDTNTYVLDDAKRRVYDRADTHGDPEDSFAQIARQWTTWLYDDVTAFDVCVMMTQFKLARVKEGEATYESLLDAAGYIENAARLHVTDGPVDADMATEAAELAEAMAPSDEMAATDECVEDTPSYDSGLAVLRDRPNEWVPADEIEELVTGGPLYTNARAAVADAAVNMDCVQLRDDGETVMYRYLPERDPGTTGDGPDELSVSIAALNTLEQRPERWLSVHDIHGHIMAMDWDGSVDLLGDIAVALQRADETRADIESRSGTAVVQYRYVPDSDDDAESVTDEYGAACRDTLSDDASSDDEPFDVTD
jgi:hypothetical protein